MSEQFICQPIRPVAGTLDASRMAMGEPGLPREFKWGKRQVRIVEVRRTWKETGPCHHGSGEQYVRKHWYDVLTESDGVMQIYFERQPRGGSKGARWWLFTVTDDQ